MPLLINTNKQGGWTASQFEAEKWDFVFSPGCKWTDDYWICCGAAENTHSSELLE